MLVVRCPHCRLKLRTELRGKYLLFWAFVVMSAVIGIAGVKIFHEGALPALKPWLFGSVVAWVVSEFGICLAIFHYGGFSVLPGQKQLSATPNKVGEAPADNAPPPPVAS